jgi:hypothetical protein
MGITRRSFGSGTAIVLATLGLAGCSEPPNSCVNEEASTTSVHVEAGRHATLFFGGEGGGTFVVTTDWDTPSQVEVILTTSACDVSRPDTCRVLARDDHPRHPILSAQVSVGDYLVLYRNHGADSAGGRVEACLVNPDDAFRRGPTGPS